MSPEKRCPGMSTVRSGRRATSLKWVGVKDGRTDPAIDKAISGRGEAAGEENGLVCPHARTPSPVQVSARTIKPKEKDFDPKKRIVGIPVRRTLPRPFRDPSETLPRPFRDPSATLPAAGAETPTDPPHVLIVESTYGVCCRLDTSETLPRVDVRGVLSHARAARAALP